MVLDEIDGGQQRRSFIYVDDFVDGVLRILERPAACQGEIFNLGNPRNDLTIAELARQIRATYQRLAPQAAGSRSELRTITAEEFYGAGYDDSVERIPDLGKAETLLGFFPRTPIAEMLPPIVQDYLARYLDRVAAPGAVVAEVLAAAALGKDGAGI